MHEIYLIVILNYNPLLEPKIKPKLKMKIITTKNMKLHIAFINNRTNNLPLSFFLFLKFYCLICRTKFVIYMKRIQEVMPFIL